MADFGIGEPFLDEIGKNLQNLLYKVKKEGILKDSAKVQEVANNLAWVLAADDLLGGYEGDQSLATRVLLQSALGACARTGEYDYPMFLERITSAITRKGGELFEFDLSDMSIRPNLKSLGHADQWIAAANVTRLKFQIGKSRKAGKPIGNMEASLKFWMEKIYKPAREGSAIPERKKKPPTYFPEIERMGKLLRPKVSADQQAKYDKVIRDRLDQFSNDEAPFWEVVNNGNQTLGYGGKSAAYPLFGPTRFVDEAGRILTALFRESAAIYRPKVERALWKSLVKDVEVEKEGLTEEEYDQAVVETAHKEVDEIRRGESPDPLGTQTITKIHTAEAIIELYKTATKIPARFRALAGSGRGGQFIRKTFDIE